MKRIIFGGALLLALSLAAADASAQTGTARGKVLDDKGQGVEAAQILLEFQGGVSRKLETKTNKKGEYTQVGMVPGMYKITATKDGYQGSFIVHKVNLGEPTYMPDIKLLSKQAAQAAAAASGADAGAAMKEQFSKAVELTQAGKHDEAIAAYQEFITKNPSVAEAHYNLGYVYTQKKDWTNAEAAYKKAIEVKPSYSDAYSALARMYQESGQPQKGLEVMAKAAADNAGDAKTQFNLGVQYVNAGKSEEAIAAFQKAAELDATNAEVYYHLGTLAVGQNKIPEAIGHLEKYLSMKPDSAQNVATAQGLLKALKK